MARATTAALLVLLGAGAGAGTASAQCTASERLKLFEGGFDQLRVEEFCGAPERQQRDPPNPGGFERAPPAAPPAAPFPVLGPPPLFVPRPPPLPLPIFTRNCFSRAGLCPLLNPVPIGAACWCPDPFGPAPGQAVR